MKTALGRQGIVGVVNTLKGQYGGRNADTLGWQIDAEIDVFENPTIRRAQMRRDNLSSGTTSDLINWVQESLCGPASPTYGKFCPVSQSLKEEGGFLVGKSQLRTFAIANVSAIVSGESGWHIPYALQSDLSALSCQVLDLSSEISGLGGDFLTSADVNVLNPDTTWGMGWALKSQNAVYLLNRSDGLLVPDMTKFLTLYDGIGYVSTEDHYDWVLTKWYDDVVSESLNLEYGYYDSFFVRRGNRDVRVQLKKLGWLGVSASVAYFIEAKEGENLYQVPYKIGKYSGIQWAWHDLTLNSQGTEIATVDGISGDVIATTSNPQPTYTYRQLAFVDELSSQVSAAFVPRDNSSPLTISVPEDNGFLLQTTYGNPLIQQFGERVVGIEKLSSATLNISDFIVSYPQAGGNAGELSSWNWVKTGSKGLGEMLSSKLALVQGYLPLSGGTMTGNIDFNSYSIYDTGGSQGLAFEDLNHPLDQYLFFSSGDHENAVIRRKELDAAIGTLSTLIHET